MCVCTLAAASLPSALGSCPAPGSLVAGATASPTSTHTPSASRTCLRLQGLAFGDRGLGFRVRGLGFGVEG